MTTTHASPASMVQVSEEMARVRARAKRRMLLGRGLTYLVGILLALWVLVPIWFIASMALTTPETVRSYPKGILPFISFSLDTMKFFLSSRGIVPGLINSVIVAVVTLVLSTLIAAPAGYATSRYPHISGNTL